MVFGAIRQNKHVITANKALVAAYLGEIQELLKEHPGVTFGYEAAVCGGELLSVPRLLYYTVIVLIRFVVLVGHVARGASVEGLKRGLLLQISEGGGGGGMSGAVRRQAL